MSTTRGRAWDPAISIPSLVGSALSLIATATVILLWTFASGKRRRDFRYALILNLTVAEFLNSLNNTISGVAVVVRQRTLTRSLPCKVNGWAGQFSVVAIDFSILAIAVVTLLTIQLRSSIIYASTTTKALICITIWIVPLTTSVIGWVKDYYGPVSGNWCWIETRFLRQRFTLNHGWRFAIFIISLCTYAFVFVYMSRRLRPQNLSIPSTRDFQSFECQLDNWRNHGDGLTRYEITPELPVDSEAKRKSDKKDRGNIRTFSFSRKPRPDRTDPTPLEPLPSHQWTDTSPSADQGSTVFPNKGLEVVDGEALLHPPYPVTVTQPYHTSTQPYLTPTQPHRISTQPDARMKVDREIWRMLLLNMYPVTYLILWIPGIANRIAEGMGHSRRVLTILQCSTQFIGLADATIYIYQEHRKDLQKWWSLRRRQRQEVVTDATVDISYRDSGPRQRPWSSVTA